jgi:hypothetical protein
MATKHRGVPSQARDGDRHHPCFAKLGPGWAWFGDFYSTRVVWLHETGLHIIRDGRTQNYLDLDEMARLAPAQQGERCEAIATCLNEAVADRKRGWWHLSLQENGRFVLIRPSELQ